MKALTEEEKLRAKKIDLIILPKSIKGTNCGNCLFFKKDYCQNKKVEMSVEPDMCCALWDGHGVKRVHTMKGEINENEAVFETGVKSPEVNNLILYTDTTQELARIRDNMYMHFLRHVDKKRPEKERIEMLKQEFGYLLHKVQERYEKELQEKAELSQKQKLEYINVYANELYSWMREHKNDDNHEIKALINNYLQENIMRNKAIKMTSGEFEQYVLSEAIVRVINEELKINIAVLSSYKFVKLIKFLESTRQTMDDRDKQFYSDEIGIPVETLMNMHADYGYDTQKYKYIEAFKNAYSKRYGKSWDQIKSESEKEVMSEPNSLNEEGSYEYWDYKLKNLRNKQNFTKEDLKKILEAIYFEVYEADQQKILDIRRYFGVDTE